MKKNRYRSKLESEVAKGLEECQVQYDYEPSWGKIDYTIPAKKSTYLPDFYITTKTGRIIVIECKGVWIFEDRYKHFLIKKTRPDLDIRFIFYNSKNKIRKGSKTTYADICNGKGRGYFKGMTWQYADKVIPKEWLDE